MRGDLALEYQESASETMIVYFIRYTRKGPSIGVLAHIDPYLTLGQSVTWELDSSIRKKINQLGTFFNPLRLNPNNTTSLFEDNF